MSVNIDKVREEFPGDGVTTEFPTTLLVTAVSEIRVFDVDETVTPSIRTELLAGIGYEATLSTPTALPSTLTADVTFTYPLGLPVDHRLVIVREHDLLQALTFPSGDRWPDSVITLVLDRATLHAQYAAWLVRRALRAPVDDPDGADLQIPNVADRAGKVLLFDGAGLPTAVAPSTLIPGSVALSALSQVLLPSNSPATWRLFLAALGSQGTLAVLGAGTEAARPGAGAMPGGVYFSTNIGRVYYSDGATWNELAIAQFATLPAPATAGRLMVNTAQRTLHRDTGVTIDLLRALAPNHLSGMGLTYVGATEMSVAAGWARDVADALNMRLAATMSKTLNAAGSWTAGAAGNAAPAGALFAANTWYGVFVISQPNGTTDWGSDTSLTATNLLAAAAGYTGYRRIGWIRSETGAANLVQFVQSGDDFSWSTAQLGYDDAADADYTTAILRTIAFAPPSTRTRLRLGWTGIAATPAIGLLSSPDQADGVPSASAVPGSNIVHVTTGTATAGLEVRTDASRQLRFRCTTETTSQINITVEGWEDRRGRDA